MDVPAAPRAYATDPETGDPIYAYKRSLVGAAFVYRLAPDAIEWSMGSRVIRVPYDRIRRVRLSFRPLTLQNQRFLAEIWPAGGAKMEIASTSWKSLVEQERLDASYRAFVTELHRRLAAAAPNARYVTGSPPLLYWPGALVFLGTGAALVWLLARALLDGSFAGAAFVGLFLALFFWQAGSFFLRNRPGSYRPEALPGAVLPRAG